MPTFKREPLQAMLYMLFRRGNSAEDALLGIEEIFEEGVTTLEQVKMFYETFVSGEYTVMEPTEEERLTRMEMALKAAGVQNLITGYLDLKSRLALRHTSRVFREMTTTAPLQIKKMTIVYREHYVEVKNDEYKLLLLTRQRKRFDENRRAYKERIQKFYEMVTTELMNIFKFKSLTMEGVGIFRECYESRDSECSFTTLRMHRAIVAAISESLRFVHGDNNRKMHLGELRTNGLALFSDLMPLLEPETLKMLSLDVDDNRRGTTIPSTHPIMGTEQWRRADTFVSWIPFDIEGSLANFSHFGLVKISVPDNLLNLDFERLKADLLLKPDFAQFVIGRGYHMTPNERDELNERLETRTGVWTEFIYPEDAELKLSIRVFKRGIWFNGPCYSGIVWDEWGEEDQADWGEEDEIDSDEEE